MCNVLEKSLGVNVPHTCFENFLLVFLAFLLMTGAWCSFVGLSSSYLEEENIIKMLSDGLGAVQLNGSKHM